MTPFGTTVSVFKLDDNGTEGRMHVDGTAVSDPAPIWMFVVAGVAGSFVAFVMLGLTCYFIKKRRKLSKTNGVAEMLAGTSKTPPEENAHALTTSFETSLESSEASSSRRGCLRPSLSMETGMPFHLRKENIQPQHAIARWPSLSAPRASIGSLQPDLYRSSDSDEGSAPPAETGRLWFSVFHNKKEKCLEVTLVRAKYLPGRGFYRGSGGGRDPFVKIFLLPDEENYKQSKVRKRTVSPKFNETFSFNVDEEEVRSRCLRFSVYDVDSRKVRHCLGHVVVPLSKLDLDSNAVISRDLEKSPQVHSEGEIQVALSCNPYNNKMKVNITKAQNIQGIEEGNVYVYAKVQLYHGNRLIKSKCTSGQTAVGTSKTEVIFHEKFCFSVPARFYDSCFLCISVCVPGGALSKDMPLGRVTIGPFLFARGEQLLHWQEMITNPRNLVTRWHKLEAAK